MREPIALRINLPAGQHEYWRNMDELIRGNEGMAGVYDDTIPRGHRFDR